MIRPEVNHLSFTGLKQGEMVDRFLEAVRTHKAKCLSLPNVSRSRMHSLLEKLKQPFFLSPDLIVRQRFTIPAQMVG